MAVPIGSIGSEEVVAIAFFEDGPYRGRNVRVIANRPLQVILPRPVSPNDYSPSQPIPLTASDFMTTVFYEGYDLHWKSGQAYCVMRLRAEDRAVFDAWYRAHEANWKYASRFPIQCPL